MLVNLSFTVKLKIYEGVSYEKATAENIKPNTVQNHKIYPFILALKKSPKDARVGVDIVRF